jgi:hypothetical protein
MEDPELVSIDEARHAASDTLRILGDSLAASGRRSSLLEQAYRTEREAYRTLLEYRSSRGLTDQDLTSRDRATEERARSHMDSLKARWEEAAAYFGRFESDRSRIESRMAALDERHASRFEVVHAQFEADMRKYEAKVALLRLLVVVPFFILMVFLFQATRTRNSVYYVHSVAGLVVSVILILQASGEYAWRAAHYYGALLLLVIVLAGILFLVLRHHRDPRRLMGLRAGRGECPACALQHVATPATVPTNAFCPRCGTGMRKACASCGNAMALSFPYCAQCGAPQQAMPGRV